MISIQNIVTTNALMKVTNKTVCCSRVFDTGVVVGIGGTTSASPGLKDNGATLETRLADDSGYAALTMGQPKFAGTNTTGAGTALLGATCPAVVAGSPYTWIRALAADGTTVYFPCWK